jgi:hypothetical protein
MICICEGGHESEVRDPECPEHGERHEGPVILDGPCAMLGHLTYTGTAAFPLSLLLEGDGVPEGKVARYRYVSTRDGYVFKGFETPILKVPK